MSYEPVRPYTFPRKKWDRLKDGSAMVICPGPKDGPYCGWWVHLGVHSVDASGRVSPSVGHIRCGHHSWAVLEGWTAEVTDPSS